MSTVRTNTPTDANVRHQALDVHGSYAVSAPAGSGKTGLLTQRLLNLLAHVEQPENILAVTFTRKAADEMRQRILAALRFSASGQQTDNPHQQLTATLAEKVLQRDKERNWQLLLAPHRLRIQTIDSFCQHLVDQLPLRSGVHDGLRSAENADHLYKACVREFFGLFNQPNYQQDMAALLSHVDNNLVKLETLLIDLLRKRNQWLSVLYQNASQAAQQVLHDSLVHNLSEGVAQCDAA